ncbi:MAG: ankyrin repeat domain-containing protein [Alphaproteobacteria bacterium]|nr:ankyrin repeat domain-containing protein [Alphaproteobacteria bacterium]
MQPEKNKILAARILAAVGTALFCLSFVDYLFGDYQDYIRSYAQTFGLSGEHFVSVFSQSALRFTLRLAYVISFVSLFFLERRSVYLCLIAWLGQLVPSAIFSLYSGYPLTGHFISFITLLIYSATIWYCWPVLKPKPAVRYCLTALLMGLCLHTVLFGLLYYSAASAATPPSAEKQEKLWSAIRQGDSDTAKALLNDKTFRPQLKANNCTADSICNLISHAVQESDDVEIIQMLEKAGASLDEQDGGSGDPPIMRAILAKHNKVAEYLATRGISPLKKNNFGIPSFIVACGEGTPALLESMIKAGAPVNMRQKLPDLSENGNHDPVDGITPLMVAAASGRPDLFETLLKNGADPALTDALERTVFDYAKLGASPTIAPKLSELIKSYTEK